MISKRGKRSITNYTAYDALGRATASNQVTGNQTYSFSYAYNLAGSITSETYPSGRVIVTSYDNANRETNIGLNGSPGHYATGFVYWPTDAPQLVTAGNGLFSSRGYNGKLQAVCDMVGSGTLPAQGCQGQVEIT